MRKEMKKILFVSDFFGNDTTTFLYNDVVHLSKNYDVHYLCTKRNNIQKFPFENVIEIPFHDNFFVKRLRWYSEKLDLKIDFRNSEYRRLLNDLIYKLKPDIIHCQFGYEALRFYHNFNRNEFSTIPLIVSFRGYDASFYLRKKSYLIELSKLSSDPLVEATFVCKFLRNNLNNHGIYFRKSTIVYSGVDLDFFIRDDFAKPLQDGVKIFLHVGSFYGYKGQEQAIKAFALLLRNEIFMNYIFRFVGDGPELIKCKNLVNKLGISKNVEFYGWADKFEIKCHIQNADVFVLPSHTKNGLTEGIPNAIMEAMAMQLPIVTTFHAGIPELVENGINGILVDENDLPSLASALAQSTKFGFLEANRKLISEKFSIINHLESLSTLYEAHWKLNNSK
jgi:colanic acid/amylovoran biosynthesis glycosyltransferase